MVYAVYNNLEVILTILHLSMIEYSTDISVEPPCVTFENLQGVNRIRNRPKKP